MRSALPWAAAALIAAAVLGGRAHAHRFDRWDRFSLPAFDAYVYVAMAERPAVFTVQPWGYRLLTPAMAHAVGRPKPIAGFRAVTFGGLFAAALLLFALLRRLGFHPGGCLAAVAAFCLSPSVDEAIHYRFLSEPLGVLLEVLFLLAFEAGAPPGVLALVLVLAALNKEALVVLALVVVAARWRPDGPRRAVLAGATVAGPALAALLLLRVWWGPGAAAPAPASGLGPLDEVAAAAWVALRSWRLYWRDLLAGGILPLALAGACTASGRALLGRHGPLLALLLLFPLAAGAYVGPGATPIFFAADVPRLLIYALPLLLALALALFHRRAPNAPLVPAPERSMLSSLAGLGVVLAVAVPLTTVDRYRRIDLSGEVRHGAYVLSLCRETLRTAATLAAGEAVEFDETRSFTWGESDPGGLARMRWFLRDGWGQRPYDSTGPMVTVARGARLLVPSPGGRPLRVQLDLEPREPCALGLRLDGRPLPGRTLLRRDTVEVALPADALYRGDHLLSLEAPPGLRLRRLTYLP